MSRNNEHLTPAAIAKKYGISEEEFRAQARKQADECLGIRHLTPEDKAELQEKAASFSSEAWREDIHRRRGEPVPFPLEEIYYYCEDDEKEPTGVYSQSDPEYLEKLSFAAYGAINDYLMFFYKRGLALNIEQFKMAREVALEIRGGCNNLPNIPLPNNPDDLTDDDFIRLGQWFLDAHNAIKTPINNDKIDNETKIFWKIAETKEMIINEIKKEFGHTVTLAKAIDNVLTKYPNLQYPSVRAIRQEWNRRKKSNKR